MGPSPISWFVAPPFSWYNGRAGHTGYASFVPERKTMTISRNVALVAAVGLALIGTAAQAATDFGSAIIARHVDTVKAGDVDGVLADYADNAVLVTPAGMVTPTGVFIGKAKVREFFAWLATPQNLPGAKSMVSESEVIGPDTILFRWKQFPGTPQEVNGTDVFVIRNGKIVFQSVRPQG